MVDKTVLLHGRVDTASTLAVLREFEYRSSNIPLEEYELTRGDHRRQKQSVPSPNKIKNMTLICDRPAIVNERSRPGDWEGDLIIGRGQRSAIGTMVDRATRMDEPSRNPRTAVQERPWWRP